MAAVTVHAFSRTGNTVALSTSTVSAGAALPGSFGSSVRVHNPGTIPIHFRVGVCAQTAVVGDTVVPGGATDVFSIPPHATHVAAIQASGTGTLHVMRGGGV